MQETVEAPVQVSAEPTPAAETPSPFGQGAWTEELPKVETEKPNIEAAPTVSTATASPSTTEVKVENEIPVPLEWLKKEFGVEDHSVLKAEREELKKLKETPPSAEYKFENDESKRLAEAISKGDRKTVLKILNEQEQIEQYVSSEVNDETAEPIIKLGMKLKYRDQDLSDAEINHKYNKEFGLPKLSAQTDAETDEDFAERKSLWQEKVNDIKMNKIIEAKLAKPEIGNFKSKIVLPELSKPTEVEVNEPDPAKVKELRDNFLNTLNSNYNKVEGFKTLVKDESVEIPIQFNIPDDAKVALKGRLTDGVDIKEYIDNRWFDEKWNPKVEQIMTDLYQLENLDKILSGVANNAAAKRLEDYIKSTKNINVNGSNSTPTPVFQSNNNGNVSPFGNDAWSEKPPIIQN